MRSQPRQPSTPDTAADTTFVRKTAGLAFEREVLCAQARSGETDDGDDAVKKVSGKAAKWQSLHSRTAHSPRLGVVPKTPTL